MLPLPGRARTALAQTLALPAMVLAGVMAGSAQADVQVLTTIKPLQLIATAITDGVSQPDVLLAPGTSPHDYAMKPSDRRKLESAGLVVWVGPELEAFLSKPLAGVDARHVLNLADALGIAPAGAAHEDHDHDEHADHHDEADHDEHADHDDDEGEEHHHHAYDPHIWTGPEQGLAIAEQLSQRLSTLDPDHAAQYQANLSRFQAAVADADKQLVALLQPVAKQGYYVFHDGYGYFEKHYQLNHLGEFTLNPERKPGARHLAEIRATLEQGKARCVFAEPQFVPAVIDAITDGLQIRRGTLDPLATAIPVSASGYPAFLTDLGQQFASCLQ